MKFKQVFFTVLISALTTTAIVLGFGNYLKNASAYAGQQAGVVPSNYKYAGLLEGQQPG